MGTNETINPTLGVTLSLVALSGCATSSHIVGRIPGLSLGATHATVKVLGAAVGAKDAERKARAIAIWMPTDTARVH